jgi:hypothetical protein
MVSKFNLVDNNVDFEEKGFVLAEGNVDLQSGDTNAGGISGYPWRLILPSNSPDSTVVIQDGRGEYEFTNVGQINRESGTQESEAIDNYLFADNRTGFEAVDTSIENTDYRWRLHFGGEVSDPISITVGGVSHTFDGITELGSDVYAENKQ